MGTSIGMFGERYSNKRTAFRDGGRFAKAPSLEDMGWFDCPCCRILNKKVVKPVCTHGFIHPLSMKPVMPDKCHNCGLPFSDEGANSAMHELMVLG